MKTRVLILSLLLSTSMVAQASAFSLPMNGALIMSGSDLTGETLDSHDGPIILAGTGEAAQSMVTNLGAQAMNAIADTGMDPARKKALFRSILTQNFDMKTIGKFALGRFWRDASEAQQAQYLKLYQDMIVNVYSARFENYSGQKFNVVDHRVDDSGDVIVNSTITGKGSPVNVAWRVRPKGGAYKIIDVMVEGVSMAVTQRNDFAGVIQKGGNNVEALLTYLRAGGTSDVEK